jgi:predicted nucleic acid-binding protein
MRPLRLFLDANVWFDAQLRDLFLEFAADGLIEIVWSEEILDELADALATHSRNVTPQQASFVRDRIREALTEFEVRDFELVPTPDPGDAHVLGAAIHAECDIVVTFNRRDFPSDDDCDALGIGVDDPDHAIGSIIGAVGIKAGADAFVHVTERLTKPAHTVEQQLARLARRLPYVAASIGHQLGYAFYVEMYNTLKAVSGANDPRATVEALVQATATGDGDALPELLTDALLDEIGWPTPKWQAALDAALGAVLANPDEWGFPTGTRVVEANRELIKLVHSGGGVTFVQEPTRVPGILFEAVYDDARGRWLIDRLGFPESDPG